MYGLNDAYPGDKRAPSQKDDSGQRKKLMNGLYYTIMKDQELAVSSNVPAKEKVFALNNIINFFKETEEYEKCHNIKKIIDKINANNTSH